MLFFSPHFPDWFRELSILIVTNSTGHIKPFQRQQSFERLNSHWGFKVSAAGTRKAVLLTLPDCGWNAHQRVKPSSTKICWSCDCMGNSHPPGHTCNEKQRFTDLLRACRMWLFITHMTTQREFARFIWKGEGRKYLNKVDTCWQWHKKLVI